MSSLQIVRQCFQPAQWFADEADPGPGVYYEEGYLMWVYRTTEDNRWQVGFFFPDKTWFCDGVFPSKEDAVARVNFLNGGRK